MLDMLKFLGADPAKTAVVIIDMQNSFVHPEGAHCIAGAWATIPACDKALRQAREAGIPVFFVKRIYRSDGSDVEFTRFTAWDKGGRGLGPDSTGVNSIEEPEGLYRDPDDYVIIKPRFSAFFQTELDLILRRRGINTLIVMGTTTPNCIRTTCYDGLSMDYRIIIPDRCTSSMTPEIQQANLDDMERIGAEIVYNWPEV